MPCKWVAWLRHACHMGGPQQVAAADEIRSGPKVGDVAHVTPAFLGVPNTSKRGIKLELAEKQTDCLHHPRHLGGSPTLPSKEQKQNWPGSGRIG